MAGAAARGAKQSFRTLIGQSSVIDVTCDSFQREGEEKKFLVTASSQSACAEPQATVRIEKVFVVMQRLAHLYLAISTSKEIVVAFCKEELLLKPNTWIAGALEEALRQRGVCRVSKVMQAAHGCIE